MGTGVPNMLQCTQDLALKSFMAAQCVARQVQADASSSSCTSELEEKIAALEREKLEPQKACEAKIAELVAVRAEATNTLVMKNKYSDDLAKTQVRLNLAEACAEKIVKKFNKSQDTFHRY